MYIINDTFKTKHSQENTSCQTDTECLFCNKLKSSKAKAFKFRGIHYNLLESTPSLFADQKLIFPIRHRDTLLSEDIILMRKLSEGSRGVYIDGKGGEYPIPHIHINVVSQHIQFPLAETESWPICAGINNNTTVHRVKGLNIYGLSVIGSVQDVVDTIILLLYKLERQEFCWTLLAWYNLGNPLVVVIPRTKKYSKLADQKINGLQILTGFLLSKNFVRPKNVYQRNQALCEVTFSNEQVSEFENGLVYDLGFPSCGLAVMAQEAA